MTELSFGAPPVHWRNLSDVPVDWPGSAVTIGVFDGFHRGHVTLVEHTRNHAHRLGVPSVLVTFEPHPLSVTCPSRAPQPLLSVEERVHEAFGLGVDAVLALPFTQALAAISPAGFVDRVLVSALGARVVVVGENFRFGRHGSGDTAYLAGFDRFELEVVPLVAHSDRICSSTAIRRYLAADDLASARSMLGRDDIRIG